MHILLIGLGSVMIMVMIMIMVPILVTVEGIIILVILVPPKIPPSILFNVGGSTADVNDSHPAKAL